MPGRLSITMHRPLQLTPGRFYGRPTSEQSSAGLRFVESTYPVGTRLPAHSHANAHFCFVLEGGYTEVIGKRHYERGPLDLAYHPPDVTHAECHHGKSIGAGGRHFLVELDQATVPSWDAAAPAPRDLVELREPEAVRLAGRLFHEFSSPDDLSDLALEGIVLELLAATTRAERVSRERRPPAWLDTVDEILRARFRDPPLVRALACEAGVHPVHLARVFRRFHRCTVAQRVRDLRARRAARLLLETELSLIRIAHECGFADQSHFGRVFRQATGLSPGRYRSAVRRC